MALIYIIFQTLVILGFRNLPVIWSWLDVSSRQDVKGQDVRVDDGLVCFWCVSNAAWNTNMCSSALHFLNKSATFTFKLQDGEKIRS